MNEKIKQFEKQCWHHQANFVDTEKFAELLVKECVNVLYENGILGSRTSDTLNEYFGIKE